jgi:hypothetical protein
MKNQLLLFVEKFFKNLGCDVDFENEILFVENVPVDFQKYYGKNEPYKFSLNKSRGDDVEVLEKGSYTMKVINSYLENSGQTTLLKIDFNLNPELEIRKRLNFINSRIVKLAPKKKYDIFFRFTFHTSFQYLNEEDKIINDIYIHDGKVVNGNLDSYPVIEGKKSEIKIPDMKEPYFVAKDELKNRLKYKISNIADDLGLKLKKEIWRIEDHFKKEGSELMDNIKKTVEKLNELVVEGDGVKIDRQKRILHNLKLKLNPKERVKDRDRSIYIEKTKHSLNINNKLFNTTLIYHPLYAYDIYLDNGFLTNKIEVVFNPLLKSLEEVYCYSCKGMVNEIYLCSNGHVSCKACFTRCESCGQGHCKDCVLTVCSLCNHSICERCIAKCARCNKVVCKTHTHFDKLTDKIYCNNCLIRCERCEKMKNKEDFHVSKKTKAKICGDCFRDEAKERVLKDVF